MMKRHVSLKAGPPQLTISLFCGGRGSETLIRELLRYPHIRLHLLVNAYDDGLSTGEIREFIPGMLGPSDFRKNLSYLMNLSSLDQYTLSEILEFRFPKNFSKEEFEFFLTSFASASSHSSLEQTLIQGLASLDSSLRDSIHGLLKEFQLYYKAHKNPEIFHFGGCSLGNLLFAGMYLRCGRDFNQTTQALSHLFGSRAFLWNVSHGENRILVALKASGEILDREARIVAPQDNSPIAKLFLLKKPLDRNDLTYLETMSFKDKQAYLEKLHSPPPLSQDAKAALLESQIILYGPGTQHSSLFPSYKTQDIKQAIQQSQAPLKAAIINMDQDFDIQDWTPLALVKGALSSMEATTAESLDLISHVVLSNTGPMSSRYDIQKQEVDLRSQGFKVLVDDFQHPVRPQSHSGHRVISVLLDVYRQIVSPTDDSLEFFLDLRNRGVSAQDLVNEFLEIPWWNYGKSVTLNLCSSDPAGLEKRIHLPTHLPDHIQILFSQSGPIFSEVQTFCSWLSERKSAFLITWVGDGEYRFRDVAKALEFISHRDMGALMGSRTQSRKQLYQSIHAVYGESYIFYLISWLGGFLCSAVFAVRHGIFFSDPLTGFRIYNRKSILPHWNVKTPIDLANLKTSTQITSQLLRRGIEVSEIPISFMIHRGFKGLSWRIRRGLSNLLGEFYG